MLALVVYAACFVPPSSLVSKTVRSQIKMSGGGKGFGGGEATRDPEPTYVDPNDPKGKQQAIHKAESFADYLARRQGGGAAPAPAPAAAPPPAPTYAAPPATPAPAAAHGGKGFGGGEATRDPEPTYIDPNDPKGKQQAIHKAESFADYLARRQGGGAAPAPAPPAYAPAPAPTYAAPAAASVSGDILDVLSSLQGPEEFWGADGVALGYEESDVKGYDMFGKFVAAMKSAGIDLSNGEYTVLAPADSAFDKHEKEVGTPITADILKYHIIPGRKAMSELTVDQPTLNGGTLTANRKFRKNWLDDAIIGLKSEGASKSADWPADVPASNGVIHGIDTVLVPGAYGGAR